MWSERVFDIKTEPYTMKPFGAQPIIRLGLWLVILVANFPGCLYAQKSGIAFTNGRWFDGHAFHEKTFYSVDRMLQSEAPAHIETTLDLNGGYVIPPFGEAHTHLLSHEEQLDSQMRMFMKAGVFYAMNQDPIHFLTPAVLKTVRRPETVDVIYTQGVVTASWNIITELYRTFARQGMFGEDTTLEDLDTRNLFIIDDRGDLRNKWEQLAALNDRFIKIIIAFTEEQDKRKGNPDYGFELGSYSQTPGIDPELLPELVRSAHNDGLHTSVHIETAADFRLAVASGTDFIAHLPASWQVGEKTGFKDGSPEHWLISEVDAGRAAEYGTTVITTAIPPSWSSNSGLYSRIHSANLRMLKNHEVPLALGSDLFDRTVVAEALYIAELDLFDNVELLNLLTRDTPQAIFPDRHIGILDDGYESSFLVLERNPLTSFNHIRTIVTRVKEGKILNLN